MSDLCNCSGQVLIAIQSVLVAIQHPVNLMQILAFTVFGLTITMVHGHQTVIPTVSLINLRYNTYIGLCNNIPFFFL